jgi:sterol desaturase/sphingolipid hydroxylase (fatty acid hydroxylase superfamily)
MYELNDYVVKNEIQIRLVFFFAVFVVMALWEIVAPRRQLIIPKLQRWANNLALLLLNTLLLRLLFPAAAVGMAVFANEQEWGMFNYFQVSFPVTVVCSIIIMDLIIYLQHIMVHAVPVLWRLHRVHHADPDFDVTTGARFHPLEMILSMLIKFAVIIVLGPPVIAVIIFEILLNATAMFNHSNVSLNLMLDKYLRLIVVTPDMHRVHHSVEADETNSNFGFNLPWWDRLFGTYREQPRAGHKNMKIGIHRFNQPSQVTWLHKMLILPFIGKITEYAINSRYRN